MSLAPVDLNGPSAYHKVRGQPADEQDRGNAGGDKEAAAGKAYVRQNKPHRDGPGEAINRTVNVVAAGVLMTACGLY